MKKSELLSALADKLSIESFHDHSNNGLQVDSRKGEIRKVVSGVDATLPLFKAAAEAGAPFDFVFTDLWMPNMNGTEFIEKLRADPRFAKLPVFALTADTEYQRDERGSLFTGVLLKPVTVAKLQELFE